MKFLPVVLVFFSFVASSQNFISKTENYPTFPECKNVLKAEQEHCFKEQLKSFIRLNYKEPSVIASENFKGLATVLFEVDKEGVFQVLYINSEYEALNEELGRVFNALPEISPATYNGAPTYAQYRMPLQIPLTESSFTEDAIQKEKPLKSYQSEFDNIKTKDFTYPQYSSGLNIPLSHELYNRFTVNMDKIGTNAHTASKPFQYREVEPYYDMKKENLALFYDKESWFGKKFFNENTVQIQGENYWFTFDIAADLQVGKDFEESYTTYNNTRAGVLQAGLGKRLNLFTAIYESQGKFAGYFNDLAISRGRNDTFQVSVPGRGIGEPFKDGFDYPVVEGYFAYQAADFLDIQFGRGKNFIGDGYRSLFRSDTPSPNAYFKMNTTFWKFKYTNIWSSLRNPNTSTDGGAFLTKYMATHYLSFNVNKRLNIGLFETVLFESEPNRGFDWNFINPVLFYNMAEYGTGSRSGKSIIGLSYKYKWTNQINTYGQLIIDEFSVEEVRAGNKSWRNKFGFQMGVKYADAFKVNNLFLQLEYNQVRPYTYSHNTLNLHYTNDNQPLAHLWGANFRELLLITRYKKDRFYGHAKFIFGERGFETNADNNPFYGTDLLGDERLRIADEGIAIGQGNRANFYYGELEAGFIVNPTTNLKAYVSLIHRNLDVSQNTTLNFDRSTTWLNFGFRTDIFNWYYDY
ncbi:capsule assembly Wzi family protein [Psychroflexus sp. CAK57W]|uniref:capsule assembly Wzi family protein n=1 Tax=Psychroflexus curvus TaxID=2873595 RepID=UPI001CCC9F45|nr:capsule assembly Wzi family protein [Psychroflexus curvus]MBZ9787195.1 capsule assembly Wzi family protein [Psychroflexus curvus]